jgi:hypothetical protein
MRPFLLFCLDGYCWKLRVLGCEIGHLLGQAQEELANLTDFGRDIFFWPIILLLALLACLGDMV